MTGRKIHAINALHHHGKCDLTVRELKASTTQELEARAAELIGTHYWRSVHRTNQLEALLAPRGDRVLGHRRRASAIARLELDPACEASTEALLATPTVELVDLAAEVLGGRWARKVSHLRVKARLESV